jgi:serine/threonine protein kinase
MTEKEIRGYTRQVIDALMYIHSKNILHREYPLLTQPQALQLLH